MTKLTWEVLIEYIGVAGWTIQEVESRLANEKFLKELAEELYYACPQLHDPWSFPETKLLISKEMFDMLVDDYQELTK